MATTTAFDTRQNNPMVVSGISTIDINETASLPIPCHGRAKVFLGIPSTFTGTSLTFTVQPFPPSDPAAPTLDPPFRQLRDESGNVVTATVAADRTIEISELGGCYAFTIVSGSSEAAARAIEVACVGPYPASGGTNNLTVEGGSLTANQGTKTALATNGWLVSLFTQAGTELKTAIAGVGQAIAATLNTLPMMRDGASTMSNLSATAFATVYAHYLAVGMGIDDVSGNMKNVRSVRANAGSGTTTMAVGTSSSWTRITSATTTVVKASAGVLNRIVIPVAATGAITVYDNTSAAGTIINIYPIGSVGSFTVESAMGTGITVVTAAADEVGVGYF